MCSRATRAGGRCGLAEVLVLMIVDHISLFIPGEVQLFLLLKCMMQERFNVTYYYLRCSTELGFFFFSFFFFFKKKKKKGGPPTHVAETPHSK